MIQICGQREDPGTHSRTFKQIDFQFHSTSPGINHSQDDASTEVSDLVPICRLLPNPWLHPAVFSRRADWQAGPILKGHPVSLFCLVNCCSALLQSTQCKLLQCEELRANSVQHYSTRNSVQDTTVQTQCRTLQCKQHYYEQLSAALLRATQCNTTVRGTQCKTLQCKLSAGHYSASNSVKISNIPS